MLLKQVRADTFCPRQVKGRVLIFERLARGQEEQIFYLARIAADRIVRLLQSRAEIMRRGFPCWT